ncbi:MAG: hypothetical protein HBSAPP03_28060 [Phycisphaerae bacterium]|nr:MAG: hypothetical protein HBSAPP03_28060 [Phycisphaerae bacterium]
MNHPIRRSLPVMLVALAGLSFGLPAALGQDKAPPPTALNVPADPSNAALVYWRVWALESPTLADKIKEQYDGQRGVAPDSELATLLREPETRGTIHQLLAASRLAECDFGIVYSDGFMALLPHLSKFRASVRLLGADAALASAEGRHDDAAERIAAIYRMSRQLSGDRVLISSLVSAACISVGHTRVRDMAAKSQLTREQAIAIDAELARFDLHDPFGMRASAAAEGGVAVAWIERTYTGPDAGARLADTILDPEVVSDVGVTPIIRAMNEDSLHASLGDVRRYYDACLAVYDPTNPASADALESLATDLKAGKFGPLPQAIAPSMVRVLQSDRKNRVEIDEVRTILRGFIR